MVLFLIKTAIVILLVVVAFLCLWAQEDSDRKLHKDFYKYLEKKRSYKLVNLFALLCVIVGALVCVNSLQTETLGISSGNLIGIALYAAGIIAKSFYPDTVRQKWEQHRQEI